MFCTCMFSGRACCCCMCRCTGVPRVKVPEFPCRPNPQWYDTADMFSAICTRILYAGHTSMTCCQT